MLGQVWSISWVNLINLHINSIIDMESVNSNISQTTGFRQKILGRISAMQAAKIPV